YVLTPTGPGPPRGGSPTLADREIAFGVGSPIPPPRTVPSRNGPATAEPCLRLGRPGNRGSAVVRSGRRRPWHGSHRAETRRRPRKRRRRARRFAPDHRR